MQQAITWSSVIPYVLEEVLKDVQVFWWMLNRMAYKTFTDFSEKRPAPAKT